MNEKQELADKCAERMRGFRFVQGIIKDEQAIAEAERRFENWWEAEGKERVNFMFEVDLAITKDMAKEAWMNGAFVARENN